MGTSFSPCGAILAANDEPQAGPCLVDRAHFVVYEAYREKDDFAKHQQTDHYARWKSAVTDWMAQPRQGVKHNAIFFGEDRYQVVVTPGLCVLAAAAFRWADPRPTV